MELPATSSSGCWCGTSGTGASSSAAAVRVLEALRANRTADTGGGPDLRDVLGGDRR